MRAPIHSALNVARAGSIAGLTLVLVLVECDMFIWISAMIASGKLPTLTQALTPGLGIASGLLALRLMPSASRFL